MALDLQLRASFARSGRDAEGALEAGGDPSHKVLLALRGKRGLEAAFGLLRRARAQVGWRTITKQNTNGKIRLL